MKRIMLLMLTAVLLFSSNGCTVVQETHAFADSFPDKYWEDVWVIEERKTNMEFDEDTAIMEGYTLVHYQGEQPAEDVRIIIRSPLTYEFISNDKAWLYSTVRPGETIAYTMHAEYPNWEDNTSAYIFEEKLIDDYKKNFYVGISWRYGDEYFSKKFFDWHKEK